MEIADHAGETNGPEPAEETGARQGRGEPTRGRTLTRGKGGEDRAGEEREARLREGRGGEGERVSHR